MKLKKYNEKRNFEDTSEPFGREEKGGGNRFVVQYHEARAKHFDFRLEFDGVLVSWAVPKGFSFDTKVKRLAVKVEDHPLDYINFEGVIPKGNYGAGTVQIYDSGTYEPAWEMGYGLNKGHIEFVLRGQKLKGKWSLLRTKDNNWLLMKMSDNFAGADTPQMTTPKNPFKKCDVQLAKLSEKVPIGENWIFEIKYDGYRMLAYGEKGKVILLSRNGVNYTNRFRNISESLRQLAQKYTFVLDGEVVVFDKNGRSDFSLLNEKTPPEKIFYVVFDVLAYQGEDLRKRPLIERKSVLPKLVVGDNLVLSSFVEGNGKESFALAKQMNLEGIVAKDKTSTYNGCRDGSWLKIKCRHRQEFVVVGFTTTDKNPILSALILGYYRGTDLIFAGKVGTGFDTENRQNLAKKLKKIAKKPQNMINFPKFNNEKVFWVSPKYVAEIEFATFTKDKILRQPSFIGLRFDKNPQEVCLEEPVER